MVNPCYKILIGINFRCFAQLPPQKWERTRGPSNGLKIANTTHKLGHGVVEYCNYNACVVCRIGFL